MLCAGLALLGRSRGFQPCRMPWKRLPIGLALFENPEGCFRQVASGGAQGHRVALSLAGALEETDDVLASPVGVVALADDPLR